MEDAIQAPDEYHDKQQSSSPEKLFAATISTINTKS
jgi:hypothetical protein